MHVIHTQNDEEEQLEAVQKINSEIFSADSTANIAWSIQ